MMSATAIRMRLVTAGMQLGVYTKYMFLYSCIYISYTLVYLYCTIHVRPIPTALIGLEKLNTRSFTEEDVEFIHKGVNKCTKVGVINDRAFIMGIV